MKYTKEIPITPNNTPSTPTVNCTQSKSPSEKKRAPSTPNKIPSAQFQSKEYAKKSNIDLRCFVAMQFLSRITHFFGVPFTGLKKYGGVPKMTNMRYGYNVTL